MHVDEDSLRGPAARTVRIVGLALLARVREQRDAMERADDIESLHDFRVAVRRLRSWMRAFDETLSDTVRRKHVRRLERIADATGEQRDLDVHIEWVARFHGARRGAVRAGVELLRIRLDERRAKANLALRRAINEEFERVARGLDRSFSRYLASVTDPEQAFAAVAAKLVCTHVGELAHALGRVSTIGDREQAHAARIAAKRLRYLLAPMEKAIKDVEPVVKELTAIQDRLGELHDAQIFGSELSLLAAEVPGAATPGLAAMLRKLHKTETTAFAAVEAKWLRDCAAPFLARAERIAVELERIGAE